MTKSVDYGNIDKENPVINSEFGINNWDDIADCSYYLFYAIVFRIAQHLLCIALAVRNLHVGDIALSIFYGCVNWVDEALIWRYVQLVVTIENLLVKHRIYLYAIIFYKCLGSLVIAS